MAKDKEPKKPKKHKPKLSPEMVTNKWKKGKSGNPGGRPADPPQLKLIKKLTRLELVEIGEMVIMGDVAKLKAMRGDESVTVLKAMFASVCLRILSSGNMDAFDKLLSRFIGKVKEEIHHSGEVGGRVIVTLPSNGREKK